MSLESKNAVVLERVGGEIIMQELRKKRKRNWLSHWLRWNCPLKNGKREGGLRQKKISNDRQHHKKWTVCRYERQAEKWRMLSLQ